MQGYVDNMKKLILIIGHNGVGKTTTTANLGSSLAVEGKKVINKLREDSILFEACPIILKCCKEENIKRAIKDGRDMQRIERGIKNTFAFYEEYTYPNLYSTYLQPNQVAEKIIEILNLS